MAWKSTLLRQTGARAGQNNDLMLKAKQRAKYIKTSETLPINTRQGSGFDLCVTEVTFINRCYTD